MPGGVGGVAGEILPPRPDSAEGWSSARTKLLVKKRQAQKAEGKDSRRTGEGKCIQSRSLENGAVPPILKSERRGGHQNGQREKAPAPIYAETVKAEHHAPNEQKQERHRKLEEHPNPREV
jgi:hypothetical protein